MGNGSAVGAEGDRGCVGGAGGEGDVGSAAAGNSLSYRVDVYGVGAGKQGRELKVGIAGLVGAVDLEATRERRKSPRVSSAVTIGA